MVLHLPFVFFGERGAPNQNDEQWYDYCQVPDRALGSQSEVTNMEVEVAEQM